MRTCSPGTAECPIWALHLRTQGPEHAPAHRTVPAPACRRTVLRGVSGQRGHRWWSAKVPGRRMNAPAAQGNSRHVRPGVLQGKDVRWLNSACVLPPPLGGHRRLGAAVHCHGALCIPSPPGRSNRCRAGRSRDRVDRVRDRPERGGRQEEQLTGDPAAPCQPGRRGMRTVPGLITCAQIDRSGLSPVCLNQILSPALTADLVPVRSSGVNRRLSGVTGTLCVMASCS
jgi:hypothetical protein